MSEVGEEIYSLELEDLPSQWRRTRAQQLTAGFGYAHGSKPRQKPHSFPPSRADGLNLPLSLHCEPSDQGQSMVCRPVPTWSRLVLKAAVAQTQSSPYLDRPKPGASQIQSIPDPKHAKSRASQTWSRPNPEHRRPGAAQIQSTPDPELPMHIPHQPDLLGAAG